MLTHVFDSPGELELGGVLIIGESPTQNSKGEPIGGYFRDICIDDRPVEIQRCIKKKGCVSGSHYHLGNDPAKNPERLVICLGKVALQLAWPDSLEAAVLLDLTKEDMIVKISIPPLIWHQLTWQSDGYLEEIRCTVLDPANDDTVRLTFHEYLAEMAKRREPVAA